MMRCVACDKLIKEKELKANKTLIQLLKYKIDPYDYCLKCLRIIIGDLVDK